MCLGCLYDPSHGQGPMRRPALREHDVLDFRFPGYIHVYLFLAFSDCLVFLDHATKGVGPERTAYIPSSCARELGLTIIIMSYVVR